MFLCNFSLGHIERKRVLSDLRLLKLFKELQVQNRGHQLMHVSNSIFKILTVLGKEEMESI